MLAVARAIGFLLLIPPLLFLFPATQARRPSSPGAMVGFAFIGPVLLALQGVLGYFGQHGVASDFVDHTRPAATSTPCSTTSPTIPA